MLYIHLHCGKTGGTTVAHAMTRIFNKTERISLHSDCHDGMGILRIEDVCKKWDSMPLKAKSNARHLGGHLPVHFLAHLEVPYLAFGLIREPLARVLSSYCYVNQKHRTLCKENIRSYFETYEDKKIYHNPQTRYYAGVSPDCVVEKKHLYKAIETIERRFKWVFPTENLWDLVKLVALHSGSNTELPVENKNITPSTPLRKDIEKRYGEKIISCMDLDLKLYRIAKDVFLQKKL